MASNILSSGKKAVKDFLYEYLFPEITTPTAYNRINLPRKFSDFLVLKGAPKSLADERSEKWKTSLVDGIYKVLDDWVNMGLPPPVDLLQHGNIVITWKHPKFKAATGNEPLPGEFADLYEWIRTSGYNRFMLVCACILKIVGADRIFVTDATGDGGVDLIGRISKGVLRSTMLFVQAKTSVKRISRDVVLQEYGKFTALVRGNKHVEYRNALSLKELADGSSICYMFMSNNEFRSTTFRTAAFVLNVLLRSCRQIAFWLAGRTTLAKLKDIESKIGPLTRSLTLNLALEISL